MGSSYIVYMSYSSNDLYFHTLYTSYLSYADFSSELTSYCKLSMTLLAFWAVEVVHVGTQFTLLCKGRHS